MLLEDKVQEIKMVVVVPVQVNNQKNKKKRKNVAAAVRKTNAQKKVILHQEGLVQCLDKVLVVKAALASA